MLAVEEIETLVVPMLAGSLLVGFLLRSEMMPRGSLKTSLGRFNSRSSRRNLESE